MTTTEGIFFSVVIPVYNRAHLIVDTIDSVLTQNVADIEIIVVDDGSTDDLAGACKVINDPRLRIIRCENGGASRARNVGIDAARGRYICFLDSDDRYLPGHLNSMQAMIHRHPSDAIYSQVIADRGEGHSFIKPPRAIRAGENMASYLMCDRGFIQTSGLCLPAELARRVRYRDDARYGDDTDFAIRLQLAGCEFFMSDAPTVMWADDLDHDRLSDLRKPLVDLDWLEDLKGRIPVRAYRAYMGWHVAKSIAHRQPFRAMYLYALAVLSGSYGARLAGVVLMQIVLPNRVYRRFTNYWIARRAKRKGQVREAT